MMFYLNRENIDAIHALQAIYGRRVTQCNARTNGRYGRVRIYATESDANKARKGAQITPEREIDSASDLHELVRDLVAS